MLNKNDIKSLVGLPQRQYMIIIWMLIFGIALSVFGVIYNSWLAIHYASLEGLSFRETLSLWNEETVLERYYSGFNVASKHRLNMSILSLGNAVLFSIFLWSSQFLRKRNNRVISELIKCGAITQEQLNV